MAATAFADAIMAADFTIECVFVPFSKTGKSNKELSLNWQVTLLRSGRKVCTTPYMAGIAHCPSYTKNKMFHPPYLMNEAIYSECETGFKYDKRCGCDIRSTNKKILPKITDVVYSLVTESDVLNYTTFEDWAAEFGFDSNSRNAFDIYNALLKTALALRHGLGEGLMQELRELSSDY